MSRKSNGSQLIQYVLRYSLKEKFNQQKSDATIILRNHIRSTKVEDIIKEFKLNESFRIYHRKDNVKLFHDCLSFAPGSKGVITKDILKAVAEKYVELRAQNTLSIIIYHAEKDHDHLHCVTAGVKLDGYSSRISKQQFHHLKIELERFQQEKFPELNASIINHRENRIQLKQQIIEAITNIRQTHKQSLITVLQKAFATAQSQKDFIHQIEQQNIQVYYRNNRLQGLLVDDCKFRFSKFGYDDEKFKQLNERENEQKTLTELSDLRKDKSQQLEKGNSILTNGSVEKRQAKTLDELQSALQKNDLKELVALRTKTMSQSQECMIDIDDCDLPNVSSIKDIGQWRDFGSPENELEMEE